jgi:4-amino-4-deoxy-L-arabinose transferase-like glycosyltransferase
LRPCPHENNFFSLAVARIGYLLVSKSEQKMKTWVHLAAAMLAGLLFRLFFIAHFPFPAGDTKFYEELACNWLHHGVYGLFVRGQLIPVDMRAPGYPAFLAAIYGVAGGRSDLSVMIAQAFVDLGTCILTGLIAVRLAPERARRRVLIAAVWIAVLCPFTANYSSVMLTEVLGTLFTALAVLVLLCTLTTASIDIPLRSLDRRALLAHVGWWLLAGFIVGVGTLVRPETPLVLTAIAIVLTLRWWRPVDWKKLALAGLWMAVGLLIALEPWVIRNARTMGRVEFLAPRYAESQGDFIPRGFYDWTKTWMTRFGEAYIVPWKLGKEAIEVGSLPPNAFDSSEERAQVEKLLSQYNTDLTVTPLLDRGFAELARERTTRHPLRTYVLIPTTRAWMMWFTPRVEFLRYSGHFWPPREQWQGERTEFLTTVGFGILGFVYVGLACVSAWRFRQSAGMGFLVAFLIVRTGFLTQLQTVEPRYVIACFPVVLALCALACVRMEPGAEFAPLSKHTSQ